MWGKQTEIANLIDALQEGHTPIIRYLFPQRGGCLIIESEFLFLVC